MGGLNLCNYMNVTILGVTDENIPKAEHIYTNILDTLQQQILVIDTIALYNDASQYNVYNNDSF